MTSTARSGLRLAHSAGRGPAPIHAPCSAYRVRGPVGHYWLLVIEHCPICGGPHTHGGGDQLRPAYGYQPAPCTRLAGYWLQPIHDNRAVNA